MSTCPPAPASRRRRRTPLWCVIAIVMLAVSGYVDAQMPPTQGCPDAPYRQFDFWLGNWDVFAPNGSQAGENVIESIASGCAVAESWTGRRGFTGRSLNIFDKTDGKWHQVWVDSSGGRLDLVGALDGKAMVLSSTGPDPDAPGSTLTQRITWTPNDDGSVRQHWQTSKDGGKSWETAFDGRYVRKKRP